MSNKADSSQAKYIYRRINLIFIIIIGLVFLYAALFDPHEANYPIPSSSVIVGGQNTASTGLSRSFSSIVRFQFKEAKQFNSYGLRVFSFFAIQLFMRFIVQLVLFRRQKIPAYRFIVVSDANISVVLFVICFKPFLAELFAL